MSFELMMLSNHFILCCLLLLLPSIFPSIRVFSNELALLIRWPKYWLFNISISTSNEYSELISFRIDLIWSPCCWRDSQESLPALQFKIINSSALSLLYGPALTSNFIYSSMYMLIAYLWRIYQQEMQETQVWPLDLEDPWRREWKSTPVFLLRKFHWQRKLVDYSL